MNELLIGYGVVILVLFFACVYYYTKANANTNKS